MMTEGWYVICADWKDNEFMKPADFCNEFRKIDLRRIENCMACCEGCNQVGEERSDAVLRMTKAP